MLGVNEIKSRRLKATMLDYALFLVSLTVVSVVYFSSKYTYLTYEYSSHLVLENFMKHYWTRHSLEIANTLLIYFLLVYLLLIIYYIVIPAILNGQTLFQKKYKVITVSTDNGRRLGIYKSLVRCRVLHYYTLVFLVSLITTLAFDFNMPNDRQIYSVLVPVLIVSNIIFILAFVLDIKLSKGSTTLSDKIFYTEVVESTFKKYTGRPFTIVQSEEEEKAILSSDQ